MVGARAAIGYPRSMNVRGNDGLSDAQLLRYSRHVLLDEIGVEGQERLLRSHALVIGAGGLGSPVALFLGSAGVGTITIVDDDRVDLTNLQRQIAHNLARVGTYKVDSAAQAIASINPDVKVVAISARADATSLDAWVTAADVVLDCSDNFVTRHAINAACVARAKPLVSGAAIGFDGQVSVFDRGEAHRADGSTRAIDEAPCYACVFPPEAGFEEARCATMGVFAPLVGIIGSMQAAEALKLLVSTGTSLAGRLQMLDARRMEWTEIQAHRNPACPVCGRAKQTD